MSNTEKALKLKSELDSLRPLSKDDELRIMQKFRLDWNYHSNHLEGNTLTYGETKALVLFGITAQGKPLKEHLEITGHNDAVAWVMDIVKQDRPLTENFIRELHQLILKETYEVDAITPDGSPTKKRIEIGQYKSTPNHVKTKTGEIFRFSSPEETPALMQDLIDWYRNESQKPEFNPILIASQFHYKFVRIHPFDDGNGRIARILMNFILLQHGFPPVIIKTEDKSNYLGVLEQADAGIFEPFVEYISKNLVNSLEVMIRGAKGEDIEEPDDIDKEISLLKQKFKSTSRSIKVSKSKESIREVFDNSVVPLIDIFTKKTKQFEQFYVESDFLFYLDDSELIAYYNNATENIKGNINKYTDSIKAMRKGINEYTNSIDLKFIYHILDKEGLQKFNYNSTIKFKFGDDKYQVADSKNQLTIEKSYLEQLTEEEIITLVNTEIKRHKNQIEKELEKLNKPI